MSDLNYNPDDEMAKYIDAYDLLQANVPVDKMPNSPRKFNPMTGSNDVLTQMENGGYIVIGSEPFVMSQPPAQLKDQSINQDVALNVGPQIEDIDVLQVESAQSYANELKERFGSFNKEELKAAGYSDQVIESAFPTRQDVKPVTAPEPRTEEISQEEVAERISKGEAFFMPNDTLRERGTSLVNEFFFDRAVDALRDELQEQGMTPDQIEREIQARSPEFMRNAEVYSNALFGTGATGFEIGAADFLTAGVMDIQEGYRLFSANMPGKGDSILGRVMGMGLMAAGIAEATGVGYGFGKLLKKGIDKLRPTLARMGADAEARIASEGSTLFSNPVGPMVDRGLAAAGRLAQPNVKIGPPSDTPMVSQLQPQYRVTVENAPIIGTGKQSFIPKKMTPGNFEVSSQSLTTLSEEFADPLSSPENYALMMSRVQNASEVPAPPSWMIEHANDTDKWANWFKGLTDNQVKAADEGLSIQEDFKQAYSAGADTELTGQLMLWSILSRRLSAFPHEGGYLELAEEASPFIQKAARGEWSEADTEAWLQMVKTTIPEGTPGRSATSNANDFGKVFLKKMAAVDENGVSALTRLHQMIADPSMSSAQIRRAYYGLAEDTGIANKILSFALLVSGRNDVVVLDRIQINRMWGGGDKIYDDVYTQFEGAQGLAQYEALERSLNSRVKDMYTKAGRGDVGSVGRYHWESWVLSSGQIVSHPTLSSVVGSGSKVKQSNIKPTELTPVKEGRFHVKYSGVEYEKTPGGGNRYVYRTSQGDPYQFTKKELDDMFKEVFSKKSGVLPSNFPGVASFEGGNKPWYEFEGVDRGKFDEIIRASGKSATE